MLTDHIVADVVLPGDGFTLGGTLIVPEAATGLVAFAHGSGSSRFSPRNRFVAEVLHPAGLGTLLLDLLTESESLDRTKVFDIPLLASRLHLASRWLAEDPRTAALRLGFFGASTGAAAALLAAAEHPGLVEAIVSRGGRPDLAGDALRQVRAPTLLIVGGHDPEVLQLNREAYRELACTKRLLVISGATHLFEERGTLEQVAAAARDWLANWLGPVPAGRDQV